MSSHERAESLLESTAPPNRFRSRLASLRNMSPIPTLALDLGSETSRMVLAAPASPVLEMPSCVAIDIRTESVVEIGTEASRMIGRTPSSLRVDSPIQGGLIAQPDVAEVLIRSLIRRALQGRNWIRPELVIAVPSSATSVQLHALVVAARTAGARRVALVQQSFASALGAGLPVLDPQASLIVEIGAEKTEIAVIALGSAVVSKTVPFGGAHISDAIQNTLRQSHQLLIGRASADAIKLAIGSATMPRDVRKASARGRDLLRRLPTTVDIKADELVNPIKEVLEGIVSGIRDVLERTPPELSADLASTGIHLSGGGSRLSGLVSHLEQTLHLPTRVVEEPGMSVVRGCQRCAWDRTLLRDVAMS